MRNAHGVLISSGPDGVIEKDTLLCNHCNGIVLTQPKQSVNDVGGICKQCMSFVCLKCYSIIGCVPFEKKIEKLEARAAARRSYDFECR